MRRAVPTRAPPHPNKPPNPNRLLLAALQTSLLLVAADPPSVRACAQHKAQQALFQAQKKASGNTFTARGMPVNIAATGIILVGGCLIVANNLVKVAYGTGKISLDK